MNDPPLNALRRGGPAFEKPLIKNYDYYEVSRTTITYFNCILSAPIDFLTDPLPSVHRVEFHFLKSRVRIYPQKDGGFIERATHLTLSPTVPETYGDQRDNRRRSPHAVD